MPETINIALLDVTGLPTWTLWGLIVVAVALLAIGGDRAVGGAARLAEALGVSKVIVGATIVSLGTTSAELFVSVLAAFRGEGQLALGNAVGSVITDTALIFGLGCLLRTLPKDKFVLHRQGLTKILCDTLLTVTLFVLAWQAGTFVGVEIPRVVGFSFVGLLVIYMLLSVRWARRHPEMAAAAAELAVHDGSKPQAPRRSPRRIMLDLLLLAFGLVLVLAGSEVMIESVKAISTRYHVPTEILAVTVVAFGTSLPELVTAIASLVKGHPEILVGNVIGADILNVLFVTGFAVSAMPLSVAPSFYTLHVPVMWASSLILAFYIFTGGRTFRRWHGLPLVGLYVAYLVVLLLTGGLAGGR